MLNNVKIFGMRLKQGSYRARKRAYLDNMPDVLFTATLLFGEHI